MYFHVFVQERHTTFHAEQQNLANTENNVYGLQQVYRIENRLVKDNSFSGKGGNNSQAKGYTFIF